MKGFIKGCLITALVLLGAGVALTISGVFLTDKEQVAKSVETVTGGRVTVDLDPSDGTFGITAGDYSTDDLKNALGSILDNKIYDLNDYGTVYEAYEETLSGDANLNFEKEGVSKLKLDVGGCTLQVLTAEDDNFSVKANHVDKLQSYVKGNTLYLKSTRSGKVSGQDIKRSEIILYVPDDFSFEEADVEVGAGLMNFADLRAKKTSIDLGAGQVIIGKCTSEDLSVKVGAGDLTIHEMNVKELNCEVGVGNLELTGELKGNAKAKCSMGNVTLNLSNKPSDFNYKLESSMGNIDLGSEKYSGLAAEKKIDNDAPYTVKLECSMGNIDVNFD